MYPKYKHLSPQWLSKQKANLLVAVNYFSDKGNDSMLGKCLDRIEKYQYMLDASKTKY